jgi:hydroxyacid-oxoacid transhydrogenase
VFRWTAAASPDRHLRAAALLGANVDHVDPSAAGDLIADRLVALMRATGVPDGLSAVGYAAEDAPALAEGTLPQHRVTKLAPRPVDRADLERLFVDALRYW